jgi:7,8-dihydropterin-6-yl-methyl-4-(beta-D-ribofuranosyl)aminobenzene 5'-phosphate synthase
MLLEPVDQLTITTLIDNSLDLFMPNRGSAQREPLGLSPAVPCAVYDRPQVPGALAAEPGFSVLFSVTKGKSVHRLCSTPDLARKVTPGPSTPVQRPIVYV